MHNNLAFDSQEDILVGLNPVQLRAVTSSGDPLLVLSGAGTGKTRVITTRIAYIINNFLAYPSQILAVTFSNKAASEMNSRISGMSPNSDEIWAGTFHSICARILRKHAELVGLSKDFVILNSDDQEKLAKQVLIGQNRDKKLARSVLDKISRLKDRCITPDSLTGSEKIKPEDIEFFKNYQTQIFAYNAVDFSDILLHVIRVFQKNQDVLDYYRSKFKYILVDEYQDTNIAQYLWLRLLSPYGQGLCCVGDDDQSIYSWRGAEIGNILRFEKDFPNAVVLKLEQNYRSTAHILGAANGLIASNEGRHAKQLWTELDGGDKVMIVGLNTGFDEAKYVARQISVLHNNRNINFREIAVLVRAGYQTRNFEESLTQNRIPYRIIGGPKFYERQEVRDILAYMRLVHQESDGVAFSRIINQPRRGIGDVALQKLRNISLANKCGMIKASEIAVEQNLVTPSVKSGLKSFLSLINEWKKMKYAPSTLAKVIMEDTGYLGMLKKEKTIESEIRIENMNELLTALEQYNDLSVFLEHVTLVVDSGKSSNENLVTIMTLHSSKGLEFDAVFLCGMEDGIFPHELSVREGNIEEERRLAYVGMTRAKRNLFMTFAHNRMVYNQWQSNSPSRFLKELPKDHIFEINTTR